MTLRNLLLAAVLFGSSPCWADGLRPLSAAIHSYDKDAVTAGYRYAQVDLNGSNQIDALVLLRGSYCGSGGCTLLIFRGSPSGFKLVSSSTISNEPIGVLNEKNHGWRTLLVTARGVGPVLMRFNGAKYPLNPSTQTAATKEQIVSATILKFENVAPSGK